MDDDSKGDLLEAVLRRNQELIAGVPEGAGHDPTPCPEWPVSRLTRHMVGWLRTFGQVVATGSMPPGDPEQGEVRDAAADYRAAADELVAAWRAGPGTEGAYRMMGEQPVPGTFLYPMMLGEFLGHGWDLAKATGQPLDWPDEAATLALTSMRQMTTPEMRGPDKFVGYEVEVPDDASPLDKLVAFAGRDPNWQPPAR